MRLREAEICSHLSWTHDVMNLERDMYVLEKGGSNAKTTGRGF